MKAETLDYQSIYKIKQRIVALIRDIKREQRYHNLETIELHDLTNLRILLDKVDDEIEKYL